MGAEGFMEKVQAEKSRRAREEVAEVKVEQYAEAAVEAAEEPATCTCGELVASTLFGREKPAECVLHGSERVYLGFKDGQFR